MDNYYMDWRHFFVETSNALSKQKKDLILDWAKQNKYPLSSKYNENDLSSFVDEKFFRIRNNVKKST